MENNQEIKQAWWWPGLGVFFGTSAWIAIPIVFALFFGKYLDQKYGTNPKFFLIFITISFFVTIFGILKMLRKYIKKI